MRTCTEVTYVCKAHIHTLSISPSLGSLSPLLLRAVTRVCCYFVLFDFVPHCVRLNDEGESDHAQDEAQQLKTPRMLADAVLDPVIAFITSHKGYVWWRHGTTRTFLASDHENEET